MKFSVTHTNPKKFSVTQIFDLIGTVTSLTAITYSDTRIDLTWVNNLINAHGLRVERSIDGITYTVVHNLSEDITSLSDTGLLPNTTYYYRIRAYSGGQYTAYSNIASDTTISLLELLSADGFTDAWRDLDLATITKDGLNRLSRWNDKLGSGHDLLQSVDALKPLVGLKGVLFDGINDLIKTLTYVLPQPFYVCISLRQVGSTSLDRICDGFNAASAIITQDGNGLINAYAGLASINYPGHARENEYQIIRVLFNGANSTIQIGEYPELACNLGANAMNGHTIGGFASGTNNANIEVVEEVVRKTIDNSTNKAIIYSHLRDSLIAKICTGTTINFTTTQPAVPVLFSTMYQAAAGANLYISWGDGFIEKLTCDGTLQTVNKTYAIGSTTYSIKIAGELDKLEIFYNYDNYLNVDIAEFAKAVNIYDIRGSWRTLYGDLSENRNMLEYWLTYPSIPGIGIYGNLNNAPNLKSFECQGATGNLFVANVTGTFDVLTKIVSWCAITSVGGSLTGLHDVEYFSWGHNSGGTVYGDVTGWIHCWLFAPGVGAETVTGSVAGWTAIEDLRATNAMTKPVNVTALTQLSQFIVPTTWILSASEINQYLADIWANREVVRTHFKNTVGTLYGSGTRNIVLDSNIANASPSGQGIIDKANLQATVNPAVPGNGVVWTVLTN
jgi:hypothetical protein